MSTDPSGTLCIGGGFVEPVNTPAVLPVCMFGSLPSIMLSWLAQVGAIRYDVYGGLQPAEMALLSQNLQSTSFQANNLSTSPVYFFQVIAVFDARDTAASVVLDTNSLPGAPVGVVATPGNGSVTLSWDVEPSLTYNIYQGTEPGEEGSTPILTGLTSSPVVISGLTNGDTYYFEVSAVASVGCFNSVSEEVSATPTNPIIPVTWDPVKSSAVLSNGNLTAAG